MYYRDGFWFQSISENRKGNNRGYNEISGFSNFKKPQVLGAIDGIHIEVIGLSNDNKEEYFNRKQHYWINSQAT